jgi:hypothetical protein
MKKIGLMLVAMLFVSGVSTLANKHDNPQVSVVILRCSLNGPTYMVTAVAGVAGTPTVTVGEGCAQALADHLNAGFAIDSTQVEQSSTSLIYTLVNNPNN